MARTVPWVAALGLAAISAASSWARSQSAARGTISVTIEGIQSGATRHVNLRELTLDESLDLTFKFRNFKRVESNFGLPPGFSAQRVFVELQPRDQKQSKIRKAFDWPSTAG